MINRAQRVDLRAKMGELLVLIESNRQNKMSLGDAHLATALWFHTAAWHQTRLILTEAHRRVCLPASANEDWLTMFQATTFENLSLSI